jgi:hypothetical protein
VRIRLAVPALAIVAAAVAASASDVWAADFSNTTDSPLVERYSCR